ncbi:MAG: hypothetical protein DRR16_16420 [Candidatus Parabeggiatoa sp. nov. 3]|nr:MAG: hypothetical protein DRR00_06215 [Gammaproteobacteria bacterium]RKZ68115.1 MAG: hypothetical protein DRQ99_04705 [Gammaproteobacteria bacterium]RKZ83784.1 MAG: hypothetical protein DRR16_16420 [Gammaproteobacteria bacterium]
MNEVQVLILLQIYFAKALGVQNLFCGLFTFQIYFAVYLRSKFILRFMECMLFCEGEVYVMRSGNAIVSNNAAGKTTIPKWQQRVLIDLMAIFPNTQLIVTTHSQPVLTTIKPEHIILLEHEKEVIAEQVTFSYGAESGRLLSEIMAVDERPPADVNEFIRLLEQYYQLIERR